jgi:hypothetical protein
MGLWEVTMRKEATCSAEVAAQIRKDGLSQDRGSEYINCSGGPTEPATTEKIHACFTESSWRQRKQRIAAALGPGCVYTKPFSEDAHGMSSAVECSAPGAASWTIESSAAWPDREHMHWLIKSNATFPNVEGNIVVKTELNDRFLASDCGSVRPGESVVIKRRAVAIERKIA